ncbi:ABC transporter permease [Murimonas intestini]|uniref:Oligopeptide transport system permease protein n=1 Tax=Murimonas intestini TaxID=1337051 RepID=A0AB73T6K6_9FIRM|nr:ABC transporter permease [Murimonas intestini]MCR1842212.1 ABC transporter permease [Murimonas intestini]MCR1864947.1 ABC transporter permease [Murimonas intestini]MCR1884275.1 ABC transporter permease [Murimonas intestini]
MNEEVKNSCVSASDFVRVDRGMDSDVIARPSISYWKDVWRRLKTDKVAIICMVYLLIVIAMAVLAPLLSQYSYDSTNLSHLNEGPSAAHWFGTDQAGRDLWARIWVGARISLLIGFGGAVVPMIVGTLIGGISGYFGGWVDMVIMRIIDVGACIPDLVYITLIMLFLGAGPGSIVIAIAISGWMGTARSVRGRMLQFKNREFVLASRTLGGSGLHQIFSSILPNILGQQVVSLTSMIPAAIFMEAYLSFIGLGVASPMTSWGQLAQTGQKVFRQYPYQLFIPGVIISVTILAFYLFGNSLRDAMDPHLRN